MSDRAPSPGGIRTVMAILTAGCNLTCSYCYQNDKSPRSMSWETLRRTMDLALATTEPSVRILFFGGEPLLEFGNLCRAVAYVEARKPESLDVGYGTSTNGTLLREPVVRFLREHDFELQISFDGPEVLQRERGRGTFSVLDDRVRSLRDNHPDYWRERVTVSLTLTPRTVPHLADAVAYFLEREVANLALSPVFTASAEWQKEDILLLDREFRRISVLCREAERTTGRTPVLLFRDASPGDPPRPASISMCGVTRADSPAVDVDGTVHACATFAASFQRFPGMLEDRLAGLALGRLGDRALEEGFAAFPARARGTGLFEGKERKHSSYAECGSCRFLAECSVCPTSIGHIPGNDDPDRVPDYLCAFNLVSLRHRRRYSRGHDDPLGIAARRARLAGHLQAAREALRP